MLHKGVFQSIALILREETPIRQAHGGHVGQDLCLLVLVLEMGGANNFHLQLLLVGHFAQHDGGALLQQGRFVVFAEMGELSVVIGVYLDDNAFEHALFSHRFFIFVAQHGSFFLKRAFLSAQDTSAIASCFGRLDLFGRT